MVRRVLVVTLVTALAFPLLSVPAAAREPSQPGSGQPRRGPRPTLIPPVRPSVFEGNLRDLPLVNRPTNRIFPRGQLPGGPASERSTRAAGLTGGAVGAAHSRLLAPVPNPGTPPQFANPERNFAGQNGGFPPDPVGDVGLEHYLQAVNTTFAIYRKDDPTGTPVVGPSAINSLWTGAGGNCEAQNRGDPVVLYDQLADRFVLAQFARPSHVCIAISQTANPVTGNWFLYEFSVGSFPDYFKLGVWPSAYFMGSNQGNVGVAAFDRAQMLAGNPAGAMTFSVAGHLGSNMMLPSDADGDTPPPAGAANSFYRHVDGDLFGGVDRVEVFEAAADFTASPPTGSVTGPTNIAMAAFDSDMCGRTEFTTCVPQPNVAQTLDPIIEWPMYRFQYRNFGTHETLVGNFTVDVGDADHAGIRWFELRRSGGGAWTVFQEGTQAPDQAHRWMGSVAMDGDGNLALGYSVSSPEDEENIFPSLWYAGRFAGDPLGTLPQGEVELVAGSASQTACQTVGSICIGRWGDYASMNVDPVDDCTFWFTGEWFDGGRRSQIGAFRLCNDPPTADANGPYTTDEGVDVVLDGSASADPNPTDQLTFEWDLDNDGLFDDATGETATFSDVGQDGVFPVCLRVTDAVGASDTDCTTVTVANVAPSLSGISQDGPKPEGDAVTISGTVTDPGWEEILSATIDWGDGTPVETVGGTLENVRPDATLTFSAAHVYGDNGTFSAEVCGLDDDTQTCQTVDVTFTNVPPSVEFDLSGTLTVGGVATIVGHAGEPVDLTGHVTDPGSDDLVLAWNFGDGTPVVTVTSLVNPPLPDPPNSPSVQPRDVTDTQTHTYGDACLYEAVLTATDDDGGAGAATIAVLIAGTADRARPTGWWHRQYRAGGAQADFDPPTLECYLAISRFGSAVFDEVTALADLDDAAEVLDGATGPPHHLGRFDRELLAAWLNLANGAVEFDQLVLDADGDGVLDTTFGEAVAAAEAVRLDPTSTPAEVQEQERILHDINVPSS